MEKYIDVFNNLKTDGFEIDRPLQWNFFFFSEIKEKLYLVIKELEGFNYSTKITKKSKKDFMLISSKYEILSPEKLQKRLIAFTELAEYCEVEFDGWEVEK